MCGSHLLSKNTKINRTYSTTSQLDCFSRYYRPVIDDAISHYYVSEYEYECECILYARKLHRSIEGIRVKVYQPLTENDVSLALEIHCMDIDTVEIHKTRTNIAYTSQCNITT